FILLDHILLRHAPIVTGSDVLAFVAFLINGIGGINEETFASAFGDWEGIATRMEDMSRASTEKPVGIFWRAKSGVALRGDDEGASETAALLKKHAGHFPHA